MILRSLTRRFSFNVPVIDAEALLSKSPKMRQECQKAVDIMHKTGIMILRDPRVNESENEEFIDMMEKYYESRGKMHYNNQPLVETNPAAGYQTGLMEELKERARNHQSTIADLFTKNPPKTPQPPPKDGKWRYMWRVDGDDSADLDNKLIPKNIVPSDFPNWTQKMDSFGRILQESTYTASEILAVGYGLDQQTFRSKMEGAPQLLGPTGSDLSKYNKVGDVLAGFHYDLSFMTIHGKCRFPGLFIWLRNGEKVPVVVPKGCFLIQAAKQLEILTAGHIYAGFHEVLVTEATIAAAEKAKKENRSLWRVSSTMFSGIRYSELLKPLDIFKNSESYSKYPPILTSDQVEAELRAIDLLH